MSQRPINESEGVLPRKGSPGQEEAGANGSRTPQEVAQALVTWRESLQSVKRSIDEATQAVSTLRTTLLEMAPLWRSLGELEQALKDIQWEEPPAAPAEAGEPAPAPAAVEEPAATVPPPSVEAAPTVEAEAPPAAVAAAPEAKAEAATPEPAATAEKPAEKTETEAPPEAKTAVPEAAATAGPVEKTEAVGAFSEPRRPLPTEEVEREPPPLFKYTITVEDPGSETPLVPLYRALGRMGRMRDMDLVSYTNGVAVISLQSDEEIVADDLRDAISEALQRGCRVANHESNVFLVRMEPQ